MEINLQDKPWWGFLQEDLQDLFRESILLVEFFREQVEKEGHERYHDYSFIVFPVAKAYEGFLKKEFLDLKLISEADYFGKHFRIGKALNPYLPKEMEAENVYKRICDHLGDDKLASTLWETWKTSRNLIFHWFPDEKNAINFEEAQRRVELIIKAIDAAYMAFNKKV